MPHAAPRFPTRAVKKRKQQEDLLQIRIVKWARRYLPDPPEGPAWTAINPKPYRNMKQAQREKEMGKKAGVQDFLLIWRGRTILPECKRPKEKGSSAGGLSAVQKTWKQDALLAGALCCEVQSLDEFVGFLEMLSIPIKAGGLEALRR